MPNRKKKDRTGGRKPRRAAANEPKQSASPFVPVGVPPGRSPGDGPRRWLLAATMILFVARPLFPSESVAKTGEGVVLVMFSLLLAVGWSVYMLRQRSAVLRFGATDAAVLVLLVFHSAAGVWATKTGNAREAMNVLWAWIGLGAGFFLLRQLIHRPREARAVVAVMIGLAVAMSTYGLYQSGYELHELRLDYDRDPDGMLRAEGLWFEPGSVARTQFEERLNSREPFATFALTNSLAGYLAPWLVVAIGLAAVGRWRNVTGMLVVVLPTTACGLLTKSRSAYVAVALGLALVALARRRERRPIGWIWPMVAALIVVVLVAGAVAVGELDAEVFGEAGKSLGYRVQYWQSTWALIKDHPVLGCGPGQFQNGYTAYKLPEASEEVADPHNFLLEIWATAGTGGVLALLAVLGCFAWSVRKGVTGVSPVPEQTPAHGQDAGGARVEPPQEATSDASRWVYGGALVGFLAASPLGALGTTAPGLALYLFGLPLGAVTVFMLADWIKDGRLPIVLVGIGLVVLLVNLLAAGGIGFPGVAGTFWVLLALGLSLTEEKPKGPLPRAVAWGVTVFAVALAASCYWTGYQPVLRARGPMNTAAVTFDLGARRDHLLEAARADSLWADPRKQLASAALEEWRNDHRQESLDEFRRYSAEATRLDPESWSYWHALGDQYLEVYRYTSSVDDLKAALESYRRAIAIYPNNAKCHASFAIALRLAGQEALARQEAETAVRLDDSMPHLDKKLPPTLRQRLLRGGP
ncbi:MAG: O-antigen ligase family protein [Pirellulales bacterium]|nr:O-antigen ligase family protein [Pirellulales bacterium]